MSYQNKKFVQVGTSIFANEAAPNLDYKWGPYDNAADAVTQLKKTGGLCVGQTVGIKNADGSVDEYWFKNAATGAGDLVKKIVAQQTVDAYTKAETDSKLAVKANASDLAAKANKATTLAGYGVTNAYTKTEADAKVQEATGAIADAVEASAASAAKAEEKAAAADVSANAASASAASAASQLTELNAKLDQMASAEGTSVNDLIAATIIAAEVSKNTEDISNIKPVVLDYIETVDIDVYSPDIWHIGYGVTPTGTLYTNQGRTTSDLFDINEETEITVSGLSGGAYAVFYYYHDDEYLGYSQSNYDRGIETYPTANKVRIGLFNVQWGESTNINDYCTINHNLKQTVTNKSVIGELETRIDDIEEIAKSASQTIDSLGLQEVEINNKVAYTESEAKNEFIAHPQVGYSINNAISGMSSDNYVYRKATLPAGTIDSVKIEKHSIFATGKVVCVFVDSNDIVLSVNISEGTSATESIITNIPEGTKAIYFNARPTQQSIVSVGFVAKTITIPDGSITPEKLSSPSISVLGGKKWCVVGDSFSSAIGSDYEGTDEKLTYVDIIKKNNNMIVQDMAVSGRTMAYPSERNFENSFANPKYYQAVAEDVDYITIYLGINDAHHAGIGSDGLPTGGYVGHIPLGTIDDTDTGTFYGAWNTVLEYLITNRPNAKIGILVTNGTGHINYVNAEIALAKKWGIPYLNLNGDERCPAMLRADNPNLSSIAKQILKNKWALNLSKDNQHPNPAAHRYMSTYIENFMKSL